MNKALLAGVVVAVTVGLLLPLMLVLPVALIAASVQIAQHVCPTAETTPGTTLQAADGGGGRSAGEGVARAAAARYFPPAQLNVALAIAGAESGYRPSATHRNRDGSTDYGLWQINSVHHNLLTGRDWSNPEQNAWMAYQVWEGAGRSWTPWSAFNSGSYRQFLTPHTANERGAFPASTTEEVTGVCPMGNGPGEVTVGTWNVCRCNSTAQAVTGARALAAAADVVGLQELGDDTRRAAVATAVSGSHAMTTDRTAVPILYNTARYDPIRQGWVQAFGPARVETGVNGTSVGPKWVTWVQLRDRNTHTQVVVINTHMLPSVNRKGHPDRDKPRRLHRYNQQLDTVLRLVDRFTAAGTAVVVTGDFNVDYSDDVRVHHPTAPYQRMKAHGLYANWRIGEKPTQGHRTIDYIWSTATPATQTVPRNKHGSDHSSVVVHFTTQDAASEQSGGSAAKIRVVTDPSSRRTYRVPIPAGRAGVAINAALDQLGKPYIWGAHGPAAFDCSGLTAWAWRKAGVRITPQSTAQRNELPTATGPPIAGDIWWHPGHVQLYLGRINGETLIVEAPNPRARVRIIKEWMTPQARLRPAANRPS